MAASPHRMGFLRTLSLLWSVYTDSRTPWIVKILPLIAVFYGLSPIDVLPDIIPLLGQSDDIVVLIVSLLVSFNLIPKNLYQEHRDRVKATPL